MKKIHIKLEELVNFCKDKGFIYQASNIYQGVQGVYDFGPLGVELKNNIKKSWWKHMVYLRDDVVGLDGAIILNKKVVYHSGHQDNFSDTYVDCKKCNMRMKNEEIEDKCKNCGSADLTEAKFFNLMMNVNLGATNTDYGVLRPETSQSMFVNFKNVVNSMGSKLPFGIAQIGKSFRNEVTTRHFIFRSREFEQMEMVFYIENDNSTWFEYWVNERMKWWALQGIVPKKLIKTDGMSHYAAANTDLLFEFPNGLEELEGIHDRVDFDLGSHTKNQKDFNIKSKVIENNDSTEALFILKNDKKILPNIIEVSAGVERAMMAILTSAFYEHEINGKTRRVLKLPFHLSPIKIAVIPLLKNNEQMINYAKKITSMLKEKDEFSIVKLEIASNIGKTYKYFDEIGTPFCVTIDENTLNNNKVTVRFRDTAIQESVNVNELIAFIQGKIK